MSETVNYRTAPIDWNVVCDNGLTRDQYLCQMRTKDNASVRASAKALGISPPAVGKRCKEMGWANAGHIFVPGSINEEKAARLRVLWLDPKLNLSGIGRELSVTKNAVIGKARRMKLGARPECIREHYTPEEKAAANRAKQARYAAKQKAERQAKGEVVRTRRKRAPVVVQATGPVRQADYHTVAQWAEGYGLPVSPTHGFDLAGINAFRADHGLVPFVIRKAGNTKPSFGHGARA